MKEQKKYKVPSDRTVKVKNGLVCFCFAWHILLLQSMLYCFRCFFDSLLKMSLRSYKESPIKTNKYQWKPMKTNENQWKPMKTNEYQWPYLRSYEESPKPETAVIVSLSQQLGLDPYIVRVWFTNRWQFSLNTQVARKSSKRPLHQETEGQARCQRRFGIRRCSISQSLHRRCSTWSTSFFFFYINWWSTSSSNHTGQGD